MSVAGASVITMVPWIETRRKAVKPYRVCRAGPIVVIAILLLTGCAANRSFVGRDPSRASYGAYLRGLMLERSSRLPDALRAYQSALEHDHHSPLLHVRLGSTYVKLGQMDRALLEFEKALLVDPNHPEALRWIAMLHAAQGELDQAVVAYERLMRVESDDQFVISTLADLYVLQGELPKAIEFYHRLIKEFGSSSQLHFNLGVLYGRLGRFNDAAQELSRALELSPNSLEIRVALGLTYELSGAFDKAAAHYEEAIRLDPFNGRLYHYAAQAYFNEKHYAEAVASYQAALDLSTSDLDAIMGLVRVWLTQRQFNQATTLLAEKLEELDHPPELYVALGIVYREAKQNQEALRAFEQAIYTKPDYAQAYFYLAAQLDQLGHRKDARANLRRTLELDQNHVDAMNYLGYLNAEEGVDLEEARSLIQRAIELDPENGAYVDSLGWVYYKMGRTEEAIRQLERAAELLDTDPVIFEHLGDAYFEQHDFEKAKKNWQRALELDPELSQIQEKLNQLSPHQTLLPMP